MIIAFIGLIDDKYSYRDLIKSPIYTGILITKNRLKA